MAKYDPPRVRTGDTFNGILFTILVNNVALDLSGDCSIRMDLRALPTSTTYVKRFSTTPGIGITILDVAGIFSLDQWDVDVIAGTYYFDIEITLDTGEIKTYIWGNWIIDQDITHD